MQPVTMLFGLISLLMIGFTSGVFCEIIFLPGSAKAKATILRLLALAVAGLWQMILLETVFQNGPYWLVSLFYILINEGIVFGLASFLYTSSKKQRLVGAGTDLIVMTLAFLLTDWLDGTVAFSAVNWNVPAMLESMYLFAFILVCFRIVTGIVLLHTPAFRTVVRDASMLVYASLIIMGLVSLLVISLMMAGGIPSSNQVFFFLTPYAYMIVFLIAAIYFILQRGHANRQIEALEESYNVQDQYYQSLKESSGKLEEIRNQTRNLIDELIDLLEEDRLEETSIRLEQAVGSLNQQKQVAYCSNSTMNAILNEKAAIAARKEIKLDVDIILSSRISISSLDLCIALGNLLDNAIRAATMVEDPEDRWIEIRGRNIQGFLVFECNNSCIENRLKTIYHTGYGQQILRDLAKRYHGEFSVDDHSPLEYRCSLMLESKQEHAIPLQSVE